LFSSVNLSFHLSKIAGVLSDDCHSGGDGIVRLGDGIVLMKKKGWKGRKEFRSIYDHILSIDNNLTLGIT